MKAFAKVLPVLSALIVGNGVAKATPVSWTLSSGLDRPESVHFDPASGRLFVSNIVGPGTEKDGNGFVAEILVTDGQPELKVLVTGLNGPKGLRAHDGTLWVSDIDELVAIDLKTNTVARKVRIEGATFLNDVAIADDGRVFVSDMKQSRIYVLDGDQVSLFVSGEEFESPNGLLVQGDRLIVAAWGFITDPATMGTATPGHLYALDLKTKAKTLITPSPLGNLDGVEATADGFVVTDWVGGKLYRVSETGEATLLLDGLKNPADIGLAGRTLYLPQMTLNQVSALSL